MDSGAADVDVQDQLLVATFGRASRERVEQAATDTATAVGGQFSDTDRDRQILWLRESRGYPNGVVKLLYDVVG